ncbi:surface-adhesin E family protein [Anaerosinus massiliensis]|uniref:surface-adhesin E family protein n=1 Tax=Massilibacillus massiliensis TaxID=1806837 RepID=UPI000DA5F37C|nr:surface-adhesin E family protein [Massilibacillus massiliensis]
MKKMILLITLLSVILFSCTAFADDRWHWIYSNDDCSYYFDKDTIKYGTYPVNADQKRHIEFWLKTQYKWNGVKELANSMYEINYTPTNWYNVSYSIEHWEIDPNDKTYALTTTIYYDKDGNQLTTFTMQGKWEDIFPESIGETIYKATVQFANENIL